MFFFITVLRALAACLITNAHYTSIYPTDIIANGGLIGDMLFFAISGYCLYIIKYDFSIRGFVGWYSKRIWRIYPPVLIVTALFMACGFYKISASRGVLWWYVYPTYYHFVASIITLYIPFFFTMKIDMLREHLILVIVGIGVVWFVVYWIAYDRSYYHIDTVREPMIRFLFMESMLLGAWFRQNNESYCNKAKSGYILATLLTFAIYFASKLFFSRMASLAPYQFINQLVVFAFLYCIFRTFCGFDKRLEEAPNWLKRIASFISKMTLEIYVVQYVIIDVFSNLSLFFPLNWVLLTMCILAAAFILHKFSGWIYKTVDRILGKAKS